MIILILILLFAPIAEAKYFAEIKSDIVQRVIVADNKEWCEIHLGGTWVETFMGTAKNYAGKGYIYYSSATNFSPVKPYPSWTLDANYLWESLVKDTVNNRPRKWDEQNQKWLDI